MSNNTLSLRLFRSYGSPELSAVWVGPASCRQPVLLFSAATIQDLPGPLTHPLPGRVACGSYS